MTGGGRTTGRLRIAQVICTDAFAGAERYVTNLTVGLTARDCEVVVIGGDRARMTAATGHPGASWLEGATAGRAVAALVRERPFDVVHAHMTTAELAAVLASPLGRIPLVATRHFAQRRGSSPKARLLGRVLTRRMAAQLAISRFVASATEGASTVVAPGTPVVVGAPGADGRDRSVLVTQRLEPEKRTDLAIRAWARSGLGSDGWRLDIAGSGQELASLQDLTRELDVGSSCRFLGPQTAVEGLHRGAAMLLAPRPDEPYGLSVVEAMAAALPVVAAAGGGHLETAGIVAGAVLYPPYDMDAAGQALRSLAGDPARRDTYGAALREAHRLHFTIDAQSDATLAVYRSVLDAGRRRGSGRRP